MNGQTEGWHLDKRVNISIILALTGQLVVFAFIYGKLEGRVAAIEQTLQTMIDREVPARLARVEAILERIERALAPVRP